MFAKFTSSLRGRLFNTANAWLGALRSSAPYIFWHTILHPGYGPEAAESLFDSVIFWALSIDACVSFGLVAVVAGLIARHQRQQQEHNEAAGFILAITTHLCIAYIVFWAVCFTAGCAVRVRIAYFRCCSPGPPPSRYCPAAYVPPAEWALDLDAEARHARAASKFYARASSSKVDAPDGSSSTAGLTRAERPSRYETAPLQGQGQPSEDHVGAGPTQTVTQRPNNRRTREADLSYEPYRNSAYRPVPSPESASPNISPRLAPQDQHSHQSRGPFSSSVADPAQSAMGRRFSWDDESDLSERRRQSSSSRVTDSSAAATTTTATTAAATASKRRSQDSRPSRREALGDARRYAAVAEGPSYRPVSFRAGVESDARMPMSSDLAERGSSERAEQRQRSDIMPRPANMNFAHPAAPPPRRDPRSR